MTCLVPAFVSLLLAQPSQAEKIARLERTLDADRQQMAQLRKDLDEAAIEWQQAQADFAALDAPYQKKYREEMQFRQQGKLLEADTIYRDSVALRSRWDRARDRFDLALTTRKTLQEKMPSLQRKLDQDQAELERLVGPTVRTTDLIGRMINQAAGPQAVEKAKQEDRKKEDRQVSAARSQAEKAREVAGEARKRAETLSERIEAVKQSLDVEERLRDTARQKAELARRTRRGLERELVNAPDADRPGLQERMLAADQRHAEAGEEERAATDRLTDLHTELAALQAEQVAALREAEQKRQESQAADKQLAALEGSMVVAAVVRWLNKHGWQIVLIVFGVLMLRWLIQRGSRSIARFVIHSTHTGRTDEDRAETLARVFQGTASLAVMVGGLLMILEQLGIPVVPLLGGAAVLGLAVAFGAQNLVKDYFTGFMVLMEDQYTVNDIIKVNGNLGGKVEKITLRMTVLRDNAGTAHFIPHGTITTVSNMSHGWSRVALEIGIGYREDVDMVLAVIREVCAELKRDATFGPLFLEDAELLGVDQLADSAVILKLLIKTKAQEQWRVKRETLRRIKHRFDELGIEIPFPHRTIYHRDSDPPLLAA